jgi:hypothetical protein
MSKSGAAARVAALSEQVRGVLTAEEIRPRLEEILSIEKHRLPPDTVEHYALRIAAGHRVKL